jgi:hypothetical protein
VGRFIAPSFKKGKKDKFMKKIVLLIALMSVVCVVAACSCKCENEPVVESNHKLIVPPNFGNMPK